jgi:hypothetical protein
VREKHVASVSLFVVVVVLGEGTCGIYKSS